MKKILYLTDLYYPAKGRNYFEEDMGLAGVLKDSFSVALCHPSNSEDFERDADLILFRNTGGVSGWRKGYADFVQRVNDLGLNTYNEFTGKADMRGKQYLLELTQRGFPVIPTVDSPDRLGLLPASETYVVKPKDGADSIGLEFLSKDALTARDLSGGRMLIQPAVDFQYEVSFYFIDDIFEYALYAPDRAKRWELKRYEPDAADLSFASRFLDWNDIRRGIQRVDACRTRDGRLLLVELEDLNPFLSLDRLDGAARKKFADDLTDALRRAM